MTVWEKIVDWIDRLTGRPATPPPPGPPDYVRPYVRRTALEEQERAEAAVRILEAYVRAQSGRWRDGPG